MIYTLTFNPSIDQYLTVEKLIPNDKLKAENIYVEPGGKGFNVARVIQELGGETRAFGFSGGRTGEILGELLKRDHIDHQFCLVKGEIRTNLVIRERVSGAQTRINPPGPRLSLSDIRRLLAMLDAVRPRPSFWVLSGSIPPGVPENIYQKIIERFQERGERCALDTDERALKLGLKAKPFMIKPNRFELERLTGGKFTNREDILKAGRKLTQNAEVVAITLAEKGAYVITQEDAWHLSAPKVRVKSDVGAGDAFLAGFLTALDRGEGLDEASRWAVAAATSSVANDGTARCKRDDVKRLAKRIKVKYC